MLLKKAALGACLFFCLEFFCSDLFADILVLKSGQVVEGKIIENTTKFVKIDFNGVELTYFQDEIASINQGKANNAASKELASLYEAFNSSKKTVETKNLSAEPVEPVHPVVNPVVQNNVDADSIPLPQTAGGVNSLATIQAALSQLPKEYQEMIKSSFKNTQDSSSAGQTPGATGANISSLPPEYQKMIKSSLEKLQPNPQETKN